MEEIPGHVLLDYIPPDVLRELSRGFHRVSEDKFKQYVSEKKVTCSSPIGLNEIMSIGQIFYAIIKRGNSIGLYRFFLGWDGKTTVTCTVRFDSDSGDDLPNEGLMIFNAGVNIESWMTFIHYDVATAKRTMIRRGCPRELAARLTEEYFYLVKERIGMPQLLREYMKYSAIHLGFDSKYVESQNDYERLIMERLRR